eukprot:9548199-Prorocentrum_lima.AAC.1
MQDAFRGLAPVPRRRQHGAGGRAHQRALSAEAAGGGRSSPGTSAALSSWNWCGFLEWRSSGAGGARGPVRARVYGRRTGSAGPV